MNGSTGADLTLWDRFLIAVTPKSHAEELVDQIYGPDGKGLIPVPQTWEPENYDVPAPLINAKQAVTGIVDRAVERVSSTVGGVQNSLIKIGVIGFIAAAALVAIYAFVGRR